LLPNPIIHLFLISNSIKLRTVTVEGKEKYRTKDSNRFAAFEDLNVEVEIIGACETIRENIKIPTKETVGYFELKHRPWFNEGCTKLLHRTKQAKSQWLQDASKINGDNLNNVRREASRYFRNKKMEYLKDKINELAMNSKNKNIKGMYRGIN
jgi:hypothetical protein